MYEPGVVKMTTIKVGPVVSFKERTVVFEVETIPVVAVPGRIAIVGVSGELGLTDGGSGIVTVCINRRGGGRIRGTVNNGYGRCYHDTGNRNPESDVCADEYLGITFSSDKACAYNSG